MMKKHDKTTVKICEMRKLSLYSNFSLIKSGNSTGGIASSNDPILLLADNKTANHTIG